jgi:hypothetical protein
MVAAALGVYGRAIAAGFSGEHLTGVIKLHRP